MKETNMEHFRDEIEAFMKNGHVILAIVEGKPVACKDVLGCIGCEFKCTGKKCEANYIEWLMSEYKPEPVLTAREKHFVECVEDGWLTKSKSNIITWWEKKPSRDGKHGWIVTDTSGFVYLQEIHPCAFGDMFPFITWEDEEAWSIEELRKLKVQE